MAQSREIEKLERRWQENPLGLTFAPLAEAYRKEAMYAEALELLDVGLSRHPNYVPALIVRGRCHLDAGDDPAAEASFLRVVGLDPENVIALKSLAEIAERAGRFDAAASRLDELLAFDRNNDEARAHLDRVRAMQATPSPGLVDLGPEISAPEPAAPTPEPVPAARDAVPLVEEVETASDRPAPIEYEPVELTAAGAEHLEPQSEAAPAEVPWRESGSTEEPALVVLAEAEAAAEPEIGTAPQELVITETMAELFQRQGHRELALAVYRQLAEREPENPRVRDAVDRLAAELRPPAEPAAPAHAAAVTGGRSVRNFFQALLSARSPAETSAGGPSLGAVFGDSAPTSLAAVQPGEGGPSYDEFFADAAGGAPAPPADRAGAPAPSAAPGPSAPSEDIEEFATWLRGLKR